MTPLHRRVIGWSWLTAAFVGACLFPRESAGKRLTRSNESLVIAHGPHRPYKLGDHPSPDKKWVLRVSHPDTHLIVELVPAGQKVAILRAECVSGFIWAPKRPQCLIVSTSGVYGKASLMMWEGGREWRHLTRAKKPDDEYFRLFGVTADGKVVVYHHGVLEDPDFQKQLERQHRITLPPAPSRPVNGGVRPLKIGSQTNSVSSSEIRPPRKGSAQKNRPSAPHQLVAAYGHEEDLALGDHFSPDKRYRVRLTHRDTYFVIQVLAVGRRETLVRTESVSGYIWAPQHPHRLIVSTGATYGQGSLMMWENGRDWRHLVRAEKPEDAYFVLFGVTADGRTLVYGHARSIDDPRYTFQRELEQRRRLTLPKARRVTRTPSPVPGGWVESSGSTLARRG